MKRLGRTLVTFVLAGCVFLGALWVCSLLEGHVPGIEGSMSRTLHEHAGYFALWRLACGVLLFCVWPSFMRACAKRQGWSDAMTQARMEWRWPLAVCFVVMDVVFVEQVIRGVFS